MHGEAKGQSVTLRELRERTEAVVNDRVAQNAEGVDAECSWPADSLNALAETGLLGLHVPVRFGGLEQGMEGLVTITETIARACSSTALCYAMHCVGSAVIAAKATTPQVERYLKPIAAGKHITTLALSEGGTGAHFYLPQTRLEQKDGTFCLDGTKEFVTNGGHADSYVVSTVAAEYGAEPGEFSCVLVDRDAPGVKWTGGWRGLGMRGNASQTMQLKQVNIAQEKPSRRTRRSSLVRLRSRRSLLPHGHGRHLPRYCDNSARFRHRPREAAQTHPFRRVAGRAFRRST